MNAKTVSAFSITAWGALGLNILVILWGAFVRATSSGNGCGSHWPLCNGVVIPQSAQTATLIEFVHRATSGIVLVLAVVLCFWAWRRFGRTSFLRWTSSGILTFTLTEAIVGAGLVLFHLTGSNDSIERAVVIVIHQVNTFLLLASLVLTAWWSTFGEPQVLTWHGLPSGLLLVLLVGLVFLGGSGAITALGDTLFPATSLIQGFQQDTSTAVNFLLRLRIFHPLVAIVLAIFGSLVLSRIRKKEETPPTLKLVSGVTLLLVAQLILGGLNVVLLAPVWLQIIHLLMMDLIWTGYALLFSLHLSRSFV